MCANNTNLSRKRSSFTDHLIGYGCSRALFSSKFFGKMSTVVISFVFDKYYSIMD